MVHRKPGSGDEGTRRIKEALKAIPAGRVSTYGAIARAAGYANGARQVVRILHSSASGEGLPWHRILRKDGSIALPVGEGFELQKALLEREGVAVSSTGGVELSRYEFTFPNPPIRAARTGRRSPRSQD